MELELLCYGIAGKEGKGGVGSDEGVLSLFLCGIWEREGCQYRRVFLEKMSPFPSLPLVQSFPHEANKNWTKLPATTPPPFPEAGEGLKKYSKRLPFQIA